MIKPAKITLFVVVVFILLALVMSVVPAGGVKIGSFTFYMPVAGELLGAGNEQADISGILENQFSIDSLADITESENDSLPLQVFHKASYDSLVNTLTRIELNDSARAELHTFFGKLGRDSSIRIMHYGDSQIEGDRITAFVRNRLQVRFGGSGPGLRPAYQPYEMAFSAVQQSSENWLRYTIDKDADSVIHHNRFGALSAFSRFAEPVADSVEFSGTTLHQANLEIAKTSFAFRKVRRYEHLRMFYGNANAPVAVKLLLDDNVFMTDTLQSNVDYAVLNYDLPDTTDRITMHFEGFDSPDIYGIELASSDGVVMDNIPLRGSSGLVFSKNDFEHSRMMFQDLEPDLFILQFGGNVMPYITSDRAIEFYGNKFRREIERLQQLCPDAAIVVIGPSDMSTKVRDRYITYEHLPRVVAAIRNAALSAGCGYWDMYQAMGGENSMPAWVSASPELARPDYTHFSARGARLIANMFYNALMLEYNNYLEEKNNQISQF